MIRGTSSSTFSIDRALSTARAKARARTFASESKKAHRADATDHGHRAQELRVRYSFETKLESVEVQELRSVLAMLSAENDKAVVIPLAKVGSSATWAILQPFTDVTGTSDELVLSEEGLEIYRAKLADKQPEDVTYVVSEKWLRPPTEVDLAHLDLKAVIARIEGAVKAAQKSAPNEPTKLTRLGYHDYWSGLPRLIGT